MLIGQYIRKLSGLDQYSPPFPRGGQGILLTVEVLDVPGGTRFLAVGAQHKNEQDTVWATLGSISGISTTGVKTVALSGCKELLRLVYKITGAAAQAQDGFYVNVLPPTWRT